MDNADVPRIVAVLGLEGCGKTVFLTTLAKRFSEAGPTGDVLVPGDGDTVKYSEENWAKLQSGHWPRTTFGGEIRHLSWTVRRSVGDPFALRTADISGQALRRIFGPGTARDTPLPCHLALVRHIYRQADRILLLVNIGDFVGEIDAEQRRVNLATLVNSVKRLTGKRGKKPASS
ncbi:MAG: hypothetical protein LIQ31_13750 [Planctomycetes bacterium]|nr:hypothetical protein [Planctomycetota bacterium]